VAPFLTPMWLAPAFRGAHTFYPLPTPHFHSPLDDTLYDAMTSESLPALLHHEDRNSMAFSIEARAPFLDYRLIEFAFSLPPAAKIGNGVTKVVLRRTTRAVLPDTVLHRRDKLGLATPQDRWLRGPAKKMVDDIVASPALARHGYVDQGRLGDLWRRFQNGEGRHSAVLWRCVNLELWLRYMIETPDWFQQRPWRPLA